ncbi:hypothetical protein CTAYLR_003410 [Chrysophaeum taylorii]|uniref:N-acetyltransferase domain-containing protein n=1 Tax=Chrysophaeum taylorii TaxID=2483200 RepID=A0AAD7U9R9_9STRA|nr:hypothetical protein CTAYLR_003410 [Chrysophaeum taylorii]
MTRGSIVAASVTGAATLGGVVWMFVRRRKREPVENEKVVTLPRHLLKDAADMAARAFVASPAYVYLAGENDVFALLSWVFYRNFWLRANTSCNRAVLRKGELVAFFMFVRPEIRDVNFFDMLIAGLLKIPFLFGSDTVQRLFKLTEWFDGITDEIRKDYPGPMCRLERVCVRPDCQGQGIGSKALQSALDEADEEGMCVCLTTQLERNVTFYERLGFEVIKVAQSDAYPKPDISMLRRPKSKNALKTD